MVMQTLKHPKTIYRVQDVSLCSCWESLWSFVSQYSFWLSVEAHIVVLLFHMERLLSDFWELSETLWNYLAENPNLTTHMLAFSVPLPEIRFF